MIQELHVSKNLFNGTYTKGFIGTTYIFRNTGTSANCAIISVSPNTTYTVTKYDESNRFAIGTSSVLPYDEIQLTGIYYVDTATTYTFTTDNSAQYMVVYVSTGTEQAEPRLMINVGSTALPYEPYGDTWQGKAYSKIVDTTQQVTSFPVVVRPMENTIPSWTIKGNMVQDGTPSPSNIIYPSETGDRTENLFSETLTNGYTLNGTTGLPSTYAKRCATLTPVMLDNVNSITLSYKASLSRTRCIYSIFNGDTLISRVTAVFSNTTIDVSTADRIYLCFYDTADTETVTANDVSEIMIVEGSTAPSSYIPYGYKLDIKSGNTTTPVYLGQVQSTRNVKKLVLTGEEDNFQIIDNNNHIFAIRGLFNSEPELLQVGGVCTHYRYNNVVSSLAANMQNGDFVLNKIVNDYSFTIKDNSFNTADNFKNYLASEYANGTPVCVWYILATPQTAVVNEPLRKIGTYADSVSGTNLPVTAQSPTTIDVDTSLKPSEMDLTYTGTKMCKRKRKSRNLFDKDNAVLVNGYPNAQDTIASSPNTRMTYIKCKPNTTYTISRLAGKRFIISYSEQLPDIGVQVYGSVFGNEESSLTITTGNSAQYLTVYFYHASYDTETVQTFLDSMMINTGGSALPYAPYWK